MTTNTIPVPSGVAPRSAPPSLAPPAGAAEAPAPSAGAPAPDLTVGTLWPVLARRWRVVAAVSVASVLAAVAALAMTPTTYSASTTVRAIPPASFTRDVPASSVEADVTTDVALLSSDDVLEMLPSAPSSDKVRDAIRTGLTVGSPAGTALVELSVVATSPQVAADAANTVAQQYIQIRAERATTARKAYITALHDANDASTDGLLASRRVDATVYGSQVGEVVRRAQVDPEPASPGPVPFLAAGVLGGALLGMLVALVRERRDPKVRTAERLARVLGAPTVHTENLSAAAVGREVASAVQAGASGWPGRVGVVVPGGVADGAARRVVAALHLAGATTTAAEPGPGLGPQIETVVLPDPSAGPDLYGVWWSVEAVVVVCATETTMAETRHCARAAAATGASVLGVLLDRAAARPTVQEER